MDPWREPGVCGADPPATVTAEQVRAVIEHAGTPAEVAAATGLTEHQVRLALEHCERNPEAP
jgi:hypothetical protein